MGYRLCLGKERPRKSSLSPGSHVESAIENIERVEALDREERERILRIVVGIISDCD